MVRRGHKLVGHSARRASRAANSRQLHKRFKTFRQNDAKNGCVPYLTGRFVEASEY